MEHGSNRLASTLGALSAQILEQIAPAFEGAIAKGDPAGAVTLLWRNGEVAQVAALGMRDIGRKLPMHRDTIFRIASMTKPITSTLILMLMEDGKLRLDDPIVKWAPEFAARRVLKDASGPIEDTYPAPRDITIDDLLTHRSGLAYVFTSMGPIANAYQRALGEFRAIALGSDEFLKALATVPLSYAPGERWHYSHATDVLGFIAERIEGKPLRDLLLERVLEPLGMIDTDFWIPPHKRDRAAGVYSFDKNAGAPMPVPLMPRDVVPKFCSGGGGLVSTADDYLKFALMLLGRGEVDGVRLLRPETVALITANRLTDQQRAILVAEEPHWEGQGFGLGVGVDIDAEARARFGPSTNGAYGWPGSFGTWFRIDPTENMVMIYLVQCSVPLVPENILRIVTGAGTPLESFQKLTYAALKR
jgi:CubicO group peptidase (beta-lactamase class C family)